MVLFHEQDAARLHRQSHLHLFGCLKIHTDQKESRSKNNADLHCVPVWDLRVEDLKRESLGEGMHGRCPYLNFLIQRHLIHCRCIYQFITSITSSNLASWLQQGLPKNAQQTHEPCTTESRIQNLLLSHFDLPEPEGSFPIHPKLQKRHRRRSGGILYNIPPLKPLRCIHISPHSYEPSEIWPSPKHPLHVFPHPSNRSQSKRTWNLI